MLSDKLSELGPVGWNLKFVGVDGKEKTLDLTKIGSGGYDSTKGADNRKNFLRYKEDGIDSNGIAHKAGDPFQKVDPDFNGTILP